MSLSLGLVLIVVGLLWFFKSKQRLLVRWERWEQARLKKVSWVDNMRLIEAHCIRVISRVLKYIVLHWSGCKGAGGRGPGESQHKTTIKLRHETTAIDVRYYNGVKTHKTYRLFFGEQAFSD